MSYFGYLSNQNQECLFTEQSQTLRALPVLDWPVDLFNRDLIGPERGGEVDPLRFSPGLTEHRHATSH